MLKDIDLYSYSYYFSEGKKELKIWLSNWIINFINGSFIILFSFNFMFTFILLFGEFWIMSILSLVISIIGIVYFKVGSKYQSNQNWSISTIENINKDGFEIHLIKNRKIQSIKKVWWENIAKASLKKNELRLHTKSGEKIFLDFSIKHFYALIRQIPKDFTNISYRQVSAHFKGLKPCLICGSIAANNYQCLACETPVWRKEFSKYYDNKRDYVKAKQLDLFASLQKNGQQAITFNRDETFQLQSNWKLLVSEEEIEKYSRKKWWIL